VLGDVVLVLDELVADPLLEAFANGLDHVERSGSIPNALRLFALSSRQLRRPRPKWP